VLKEKPRDVILEESFWVMIGDRPCYSERNYLRVEDNSTGMTMGGVITCTEEDPFRMTMEGVFEVRRNIPQMRDDNHEVLQ